MTNAPISPEGSASVAARPFNPWLWAGAMVLGLGLGLLVWQGVTMAISIPLALFNGGMHGMRGQALKALVVGSLPGGMLAGLLVGFIQARVLRPSLPGLPEGSWLLLSALGHGVGLTALALIPLFSKDGLGLLMGAAVWGLCVGMMQAWPLLQARVLRAPFWMFGCFVGFAVDGPVSAVGQALRSPAASVERMERMEWMGVLTWAPWLVSLVGVGVVTGFAMRWVLAGPRIPRGTGPQSGSPGV